MRKTVRLKGRRGRVLLTGAAAVTVGVVALGLVGSAAGLGDSGTESSVRVLPAVPYPVGPVPGESSGTGASPGVGAGDASTDSDAARDTGGARDSAPEIRAQGGNLAAPEPGAPGASAAKSGASVTKIVPPEPGPDPGQGTVPPDVVPDRSVIRTARLSLDVKDLPAATAAVRDTAVSVGGFVANEHTVDRSSSFTVRVPSDRLDEVMARLAATGTVTERYGQAEDVTDQMVDLQSRLATQKASVARVRALLERASTVGEVVGIESELASRESELESLQRRLASVSGRVSMSTLTVALNPTPVPAPVEPADGSGFLAGLTAGWQAFVAATGGVLTALGAVLPFAVLLAVVVGAALAVRRALRRHRAATAALAAMGEGKSG